MTNLELIAAPVMTPIDAAKHCIELVGLRLFVKRRKSRADPGVLDAASVSFEVARHLGMAERIRADVYSR